MTKITNGVGIKKRAFIPECILTAVSCSLLDEVRKCQIRLLTSLGAAVDPRVKKPMTLCPNLRDDFFPIHLYFQFMLF